MASGNSGYSQSSRKHETMRQLRTDLNLCRLPEEKMSCDRREPDDSSTYSDGGLFENRNNASGANALFDSMPYQLENMDPVPMPQGSRGIDLRDDEDGLPHKLRPHKDVGGKFQGGVLFAAQRPGSSAPALPMTRFFRSHLAQKEEEELSSTFAHQRKEKATEIVFPNTYFGGASMDEDQ
eukprot:CAMPEP_0196574652 /NCGR_PEP_ID=MMETSP1081-20130531/4323_1 /TAXON_ID=36882 /ORGANISM="Pyramimonas amylifera, Strain CCMP720" /LENGTH=179 /DNA_ID=CAMNT_0041892745 /DNA_START=506 /DNA_END=1046 /DNA_ORIENTATION=-